jgi:hypothetical protein
MFTHQFPCKCKHLLIIQVCRVFQEERSTFWEVISVILSKKFYMYMCPIPNGFRDATISLYSSKLLIPVFIVQYRLPTIIYFLKIPPSTSVYFATRVRTWRVARLSASCRTSKLLYSEIALSRKTFGVGHMYV